MKIVVMSCDKSNDTFELFNYCIEKYWPTHPEVIYITETIKNPYYKTICKNYTIKSWSKKIREALKEINDNDILLMCDDIFIRSKVDDTYINSLLNYFNDQEVACIHFEQSFLPEDIPFDNNLCECNSWLRCSMMCGLWDKEKLLKVFDVDLDPWAFERLNNHNNYKYFISNGKDIINWGKQGTGYHCWGIFKGKWSRETVNFAKKNNLVLDLSRGIVEDTPHNLKKKQEKERQEYLKIKQREEDGLPSFDDFNFLFSKR